MIPLQGPESLKGLEFLSQAGLIFKQLDITLQYIRKKYQGVMLEIRDSNIEFPTNLFYVLSVGLVQGHNCRFRIFIAGCITPLGVP